MAFFVAPSIRAAGPSGGAVMRELAGVRKLPTYMLTAGWITVLSGLALYGRNSAGNGWGGSPSGMTYGIGGLFALIAVLIGTFWARPAAVRLGALGEQVRASGGAPSPDVAARMQQLQATMGKATMLAALCILVAVVAMSIARYV